MTFRAKYFSALLLLGSLALYNSCGSKIESSPPQLTDDTTDPESHLEEDSTSKRCQPDTGLSAAMNTCSVQNPCHRVNPIQEAQSPLKSSDFNLSCSTTEPNHPYFSDPLLQIQGIDGIHRDICFYEPPDASSETPLPLVIFFHGMGGKADNLYDFTLLRQKAIDFHLSKLGPQKGFYLISLQARNLHWPGQDLKRDGALFDTFFLDSSIQSKNPDMQITDKIIDQFTRDKFISSKEIYLIGWSNGAAFAGVYATLRDKTPTARGNKIAGVFAYSIGDSFGGIELNENPSCGVTPRPKSKVPYYLISRSCDVVTFSYEQQQRFLQLGAPISKQQNANKWYKVLTEEMENDHAVWTLINRMGQVTDTCTPPTQCSYLLEALSNHLNWPNGVNDGGGVDHEIHALNLLKLNNSNF